MCFCALLVSFVLAYQTSSKRLICCPCIIPFVREAPFGGVFIPAFLACYYAEEAVNEATGGSTVDLDYRFVVQWPTPG